MTPYHLKNAFVRLLTVCSCVTSTWGADQITRLNDGATIRGKFEIFSKTSVVIRQPSDETITISTDDIMEVRFDREPPLLQAARSNERSGSYTSAIQQLQKILSEYTGRDKRVLTEIEFLVARCQARLARSNPETTRTALATLQSFLQQNGNSYRTLEVMLLQAQLLSGTERSQAIRLLEQLRSSGVDGFAMQAGVVLGHVLLSEARPGQAEDVFNDVVRKSDGKATALKTHYESRIGRAECLLKQDRPEQALKELKFVIAEIPGDQHTALARAWLHTGHGHRQSDQPQAALLAYLHVDILYQDAKVEHAEALYQLTALWEAAGYPDRARDSQSRLLAQYPDSRRAAQANE